MKNVSLDHHYPQMTHIHDIHTHYILHITRNLISYWLIKFISSLIKSIQLILPFHLRLYLPSIASSAGDYLQINCHHLDERRDYRRLLVQLEETERRFDEFWNSHLTRLKQCLDLRRFEQDFRELQVWFEWTVFQTASRSKFICFSRTLIVT